MKKVMLAVMLLALAGSQMQTAKAHGGWGWGVGVGVLGGFAIGTAVGASYSHPIYYDSYYYAPRPYWGTGFYSPGYYYPPAYSSAYYYPTAPSAPQPQVAPAPQNVTINNNYYNAPASPMNGANSLFGR